MIRRWARRVVAAGILLPAAACTTPQPAPAALSRPRPAADTGQSTSRADLDARLTTLRARVARDPRDRTAVLPLVDALLRATRVTGHAGHTMEAEETLRRLLEADPDDYLARRSLATVRLSQHRFGDALGEAERCLQVRTDDDVVYGIVGDAHLERGDFTAAFTAFDRMNALKPSASSYARASYARELQGNLAGAIRSMAMALEATPPSDAEGVAWHRAQLGHLHLTRGEIDAAAREYAHADHVFPNHPFAAEGLARVAAARGHLEDALAIVSRQVAGNPQPSDLAFAGDLYAALGRNQEAERHYRLADAAWRSDAPEPGQLARFLADRGRRLDETLRLAESAYAERKDVITTDGFAWALFQNGHIDRAADVMARLVELGTRDRIVLYHAAAISERQGQAREARRLIDLALEGAPRFDLVLAPQARHLRDRLVARTVASR